MADGQETVWMTYDEAAVQLRIKPDSVRRRAASRKWPRRTGNDGLARVGIPLNIIPDVIPAATPAITPEIPDNSDAIRIAVLENETSQLRERLDEMRSDRDRLAALLDKSLEAKTWGFLRIFRR